MFTIEEAEAIRRMRSEMGKKGGAARAKKLGKARTREIALKASKAAQAARQRAEKAV